MKYTLLQSMLTISNLESDEAKTQLLIALESLNECRQAIELLQQDLMNSNESIAKANLLLSQYEKEVKKETFNLAIVAFINSAE